MRVRSPGVPDEPPDNGDPNNGADSDDRTQPDDAADDGAVSFQVPTTVAAAKLAAAALLVLVAALAANLPQRVVGLCAGIGIAIYGVRDLLARERLRADVDGVTAVRGFAGRRHLEWSQIERIHVDSRPRFGARSETLEVDAGDELYLYGRMDLGMDPHEAAAAIARVRPG